MTQSTSTAQRKLAAIMFTDIAGYTEFSANDEDKALRLLDLQREILQPIVKQHNGEWLKEIGDGLLLSFSSSKNAVICAIEIQNTIKGIESLNLRIGIHQGDILVKDGDIFGDDVNIASRIEPFSAIGGVAISGKVNEDLLGSPDIVTKYIGKPKLKGVKQEAKVYCIISHKLPETQLSKVHAKLERKSNRWLTWAIPSIIVLIVSIWFLQAKYSISSTSKVNNWRVGILPFRNFVSEVEISEWPELIQTLLVSEMTGIEGLGVIDPLSLNSFLKSTLGSIRPPVDQDLSDAISNTDIALLIDGSIVKSPEGYKIQSTLVDQSKAEVQYVSNISVESYEELSEAIYTLSQRIIEFLELKTLKSSDDKNLKPWLEYRKQNIFAVKAFMQASNRIFMGESGAEKYLVEAIELDSTFISPRIWFIAGLVQQNRTDEANEQLQFLLTRESYANPFERAMIEWAGAYLASDLVTQASSLEVALNYSPGNNILLVNLAWVRFLMEDYNGALEALIPAVEMKWNYPPLYPLYAQCHIKLGNINKAKKALEKSLSCLAV